MFKGAETKAWDERSAELATKATSWEKAADGIKRELSLTTEKRVSKEAEGVAASNAKDAPQHAKQQARAGAIAEVQKRLETALKSHRERQQERKQPEERARTHQVFASHQMLPGAAMPAAWRWARAATSKICPCSMWPTNGPASWDAR